MLPRQRSRMDGEGARLRRHDLLMRGTYVRLQCGHLRFFEIGLRIAGNQSRFRRVDAFPLGPS